MVGFLNHAVQLSYFIQTVPVDRSSQTLNV